MRAFLRLVLFVLENVAHWVGQKRDPDGLTTLPRRALEERTHVASFVYHALLAAPVPRRAQCHRDPWVLRKDEPLQSQTKKVATLDVTPRVAT